MSDLATVMQWLEVLCWIAVFIWSALSTIVTLASIIAAFTPCPQDDAVMKDIRRFVEKLALNIRYAGPDRKG